MKLKIGARAIKFYITMEHILDLIMQIQEGSSVGIYENSKYQILKETFNNAKSFKVYAEELKGTDFISFNYYITSKSHLLKPCEMPEEKVMHFLENVVLPTKK